MDINVIITIHGCRLGWTSNSQDRTQRRDHDDESEKRTSQWNADMPPTSSSFIRNVNKKVEYMSLQRNAAREEKTGNPRQNSWKDGFKRLRPRLETDRKRERDKDEKRPPAKPSATGS